MEAWVRAICLSNDAWGSAPLSPEGGREAQDWHLLGIRLLSVSWISRQVRLPPGGGAADAKGLFWVLDEEVRVEGSSDSAVLERLCAAFEKKGAGAEGKGVRELGSWNLSLSAADKALIRPAQGRA